MIVLTIRTDNPWAELAIYKRDDKLAEEKWHAHGTLAETINVKIDKLLNKSSIKLDDIGGIVCFQGPGSFTGLRIGISVANALAYAENIPIAATRGRDWLEKGIKELESGKNQKITVPFYGRPAATTRQRK